MPTKLDRTEHIPEGGVESNTTVRVSLNTIFEDLQGWAGFLNNGPVLCVTLSVWAMSDRRMNAILQGNN
jgi:hypothetical protein